MLTLDEFNRAKESLMTDEALSLLSYRDTTGNLTIGYGRNISKVGLRPLEANFMLENDIAAVDLELCALSFYNDLAPARKVALVNMCFNLGYHGLLEFHDMINFIASGAFDKAADAMLNSLWAKQVGLRAQRLSSLMRSGQFA